MSFASIIETEIKKYVTEIKTTRLTKIGEYMVDKIKDGYESQLMGGPELAEATIIRKGSSIKLIDTGKMKDSFKFEVDNGVLQIGSDYGADTIGMPLCEIHEHGTGRIPARPLLKVVFEKEEGIIEEMLMAVGK